MGERRENLKKSLGISEYPWSSDEEEAESHPGPVLRNENEGSRPSGADNAGTSGGQPPPPFLSGQQRGQLFWSMPPLAPTSSRRHSVLNLNRSRANTHRDDVPLSLVSRNHQSQIGSPNSVPTDLQRILGLRKIHMNRPPSRDALRCVINQRPSSRNVAAVLERISARNNRQAGPTHTLRRVSNADMTARLQHVMGDMGFGHSSAGSPAIFHSSLPRARSEISHRYPQTPPASQDQPVNLSDDGFLEPDLNGNRLMSAPPDDDIRNEMNIDNDEPPAEGEPGIGPAADVNNDEAAIEPEGVPEPEGAETLEGSAMSLEEVVEIEPGAPETDHIEPPATEEPVANTSTAAEVAQVTQPHGVKRKRECDEDNTNDLGTVREFNQNLLRLLECPVCLEWMEPPMWQCRRGHLVCGRCRARLAACPVCRTTFSSVRNRAMEGVAEMLRYPCRHGCGCSLQLRRRAGHEASCSARRYRCPAPQCATTPPLPHKLLEPHFRSKHLSMVKIGCSHDFSMRVNSEQHDNYIIMALGELFHLRVDVDIRTWGVVVYVAYIGPKCNAADYTYEVKVTGQHNSRLLVYRRATHCDLECSSLTVSRQDCFHLTLDQALNFLRVRNHHAQPDKYLHFSVDITRNEANNENEDSN